MKSRIAREEAVVASDRSDSPTKPGGPIEGAHRRGWSAYFHPGLALVLAGVLVPIALWYALPAVFAALDRLARSLGVA
jgi:hypothetical protein